VTTTVDWLRELEAWRSGGFSGARPSPPPRPAVRRLDPRDLSTIVVGWRAWCAEEPVEREMQALVVYPDGSGFVAEVGEPFELDDDDPIQPGRKLGRPRDGRLDRTPRTNEVPLQAEVRR
jgi:hypothetical protein